MATSAASPTPQNIILFAPRSALSAFSNSTLSIILEVSLIADTEDPTNHRYWFLDLPIKKTVKVDLKKTVPKLESTEDEEIRAIIEGDQAEIELFKESEGYREMKESGVKIVLRPKLENIDELRVQSLDVPFAREIIDYVVENNPMLTQACKEMFAKSELQGRESLTKLLNVSFQSDDE